VLAITGSRGFACNSLVKFEVMFNLMTKYRQTLACKHSPTFSVIVIIPITFVSASRSHPPDSSPARFTEGKKENMEPEYSDVCKSASGDSLCSP
jgi:hypothetical protein